MASFQVGATTATFGAMIDGAQDQGGAVRTLSISVHYTSEAQWEALRSLLSYNVEVIPMPWGSTVEVAVKGGAGVGTLTIAGLTSPTYQAYLSDVGKNRIMRAGHSIGKATFLLVS